MSDRLYDKFDNDTYVEVLSLDPASDVEAHMFRDPNGRCIGPGRVRGSFSVETKTKAANSVLQFPSAGESGLVSMKKSIKLWLPMPMSLVRRYARKPEGVTYGQSVPVFFDSKLERFVVLMDKRFLRDISASELDLFKQQNKGKFKEYQHVGKTPGLACTYLGLLYESISAIREDADDSPLRVINKAYKQYNLRIEDGEKVILLKVAQDERSGSLLVGHNFGADLLSRIVRHQFEFEFTIAYRFDSTCYLVSEAGEIIQEGSFHVDKRRDQDDTIKGFAAIGKVTGNFALLVLPYTDEQFGLLTRLHARMHELSADIMALVRLHQKPAEKLDSQIDPTAGSLPWIKPLLIDYEAADD